jgi:hypothetical protein
MLLATLSLALLANQPNGLRTSTPRADHIVRASVQILAAEEIRFDRQPLKQRGPSQNHRQHRTRDGMPMVEFY